MIKKCHKQDIFVDRIQRSLGVPMGDVSCKIVDQEGMAEVMQGSGWSKNDANGVVGFQVGKDVFVLESAPWTVLHELIHRSGVNSDRLSRFVAEGLTEAIAAELKASPDEHRPTYPAEVRWIKEKLLPALGMTAVQLGRVIVHSQDPPKDLANLMAKARPGLSADQVEQDLQPQRAEPPSNFNKLQWECSLTRLGSTAVDPRVKPVERPPCGWRGVVADLGPSVLMVSGAALMAYGASKAIAESKR